MSAYWEDLRIDVEGWMTCDGCDSRASWCAFWGQDEDSFVRAISEQKKLWRAKTWQQFVESVNEIMRYGTSQQLCIVQWLAITLYVEYVNRETCRSEMVDPQGWMDGGRAARAIVKCATKILDALRDEHGIDGRALFESAPEATYD